jgi:hypothetical protein
MMAGRLCWCVGLAALVASCGGAEGKTAGGGVVDSVVSRDTAIARFQRKVPRVASFQDGAGSRDQLVRRFVAALESGDTTALRSLLLNQSEFGWLYYPTHPEGMSPYNLTPQLMWFTLQGSSGKGYRLLLQQRAGIPLHYVGYRCEAEPSHQGENTVWGPCVVLRKTQSGDILEERLFGQIIDRGGRYKFVSYANKL